MTDHTPGPWEADKFGQIWRAPIGMIRHEEHHKPDKPLATTHIGWLDNGHPYLENAALIAAAPELLEFAKWVLSLKTGGQIEGRACEVVARATGKITINTDDPDLLWHADHADESAAEHADELAERYADDMEKDTSWTFPVFCYRQMPDRRMKITLSQGEDRIMHWEWVPIASAPDLLAALEMVFDDPTIVDAKQSAFEAARAAIAKAKGNNDG